MKQEYVELQNDIKIVRTLKWFFYKFFLSIFFSSFNLDCGYGNERRLFSGSLPVMLLTFFKVWFKKINSVLYLFDVNMFSYNYLFLKISFRFFGRVFGFGVTYNTCRLQILKLLSFPLRELVAICYEK